MKANHDKRLFHGSPVLEYPVDVLIASYLEKEARERTSIGPLPLYWHNTMIRV